MVNHHQHSTSLFVPELEINRNGYEGRLGWTILWRTREIWTWQIVGLQRLSLIQWRVLRQGKSSTIISTTKGNNESMMLEMEYNSESIKVWGCYRKIRCRGTEATFSWDIKPDNFLMSLGRCANQVHAIDFGLAKKYRDSSTHRHIPYRENKNLTGTARYASMNPSLMEHKRGSSRIHCYVQICCGLKPTI
ncbi:unnamed protein product [Lactuca saligna]|uniref:Protein kinase domain-containing protein n=1 Tax=Lactuca saligna TaxID=75948 RepID=A0AA36EQC0_LACSI|nr:unnamed protein product [Lactuca saligna]